MSNELPEVLFDLHRWDELSLRDCEDIAHTVEKKMPSSFRFVGVKSFAAGTRRHHIALFSLKGARNYLNSIFALLPGSIATLGYDRTHRPVPDEEFVREWQESALYYHFDEVTIDGASVRDILPLNYDALYFEMDHVLSPLRTVTILPFLFETKARTASMIVAPPISRPGNLYEYRSHYPIPQNAVREVLEYQGFRLPTSDEWEYACAAGSRTLFYWGDGNFSKENEISYRHPAPNAFGLYIAQDTYQREFCEEQGVMRGGDGGASACGGCGVLANELTLASSYIGLAYEDYDEYSDYQVRTLSMASDFYRSLLPDKEEQKKHREEYMKDIQENGTYGGYVRRVYNFIAHAAND